MMLGADLPLQVARALAQGKIAAAQLGAKRMSPELSYGRHAGPAPMTARLAAVVMLLFRRAGHWHLPLTVRHAGLARHGGQVSLPGGAIDAGETSAAAALRELHEELGINTGVELLGQLAECYVFASDFLIAPWVAVTECEPRWQPQELEVDGVVEVPLEMLLNEHTYGITTIQHGGLIFRAPCLQIESTYVWGATAVIVGELAAVLQSLGK